MVRLIRSSTKEQHKNIGTKAERLRHKMSYTWQETEKSVIGGFLNTLGARERQQKVWALYLVGRGASIGA